MRSFKEASKTYGKRSSRGVLLTSSAYKGTVWKPKWDNNIRLETHFRPVGPMNEAQTEFLPWRLTGEESDLGPWLATIPIFKGGTARTTTFIPAFEDPNSPGDALVDYDTHRTPATEFLLNAKKFAWNDPTGRLKKLLLEGGQGRGPALPKYIGTCGLMQGILLQHGDRDYYKRPQMPVMLLMSKSALIALVECLNEEVDGYTGNMEDYAKRFKSGDVLEVSTGRILSFFNATTKTGVPVNGADVAWDKAGGLEKTKQAKTELAHYACELRQQLPLPRLPDGRIKFAAEGNIFTPWEKAIRFLDEKEMVDTIVRAYEDLPQLLLDCLRPYYDQLPAFVKQNATVQVGSGIQNATQTTASTVRTPVTSEQPEPNVNVAAVDWNTIDENEESSNGVMDQINPEDLYQKDAATPVQTAPVNTQAHTEDKVSAALNKLGNLRAKQAATSATQ